MAATVPATTPDLVCDIHCCVDFDAAETWLPELARYRRAGVDFIHLNVGDADTPLPRVLANADLARRWLTGRPGEYVLVRRLEDAHRAKREGRLAVCFDVEGAYAVGSDLGAIARLHEAGVGWMAMVYNRANLVGAGCHDATDEGLTAFGRRLIAEMDRIGMVKDVVHTGYRTALDVCAASKLPVIISHSNPRALVDHPRCVPDELMRACAATGGVLGISGLSLFLGDKDATSERVAQHIDYAVNLMGIDHVAIGTDYCFTDLAELDRSLAQNRHTWPAGFGYDSGIRFVQPEQFPEIGAALVQRGYRKADVAKVLGGNFMRVLARVWK